jgi:hypothetical protein
MQGVHEPGAVLFYKDYAGKASKSSHVYVREHHPERRNEQRWDMRGVSCKKEIDDYLSAIASAEGVNIKDAKAYFLSTRVDQIVQKRLKEHGEKVRSGAEAEGPLYLAGNSKASVSWLSFNLFDSLIGDFFTIAAMGRLTQSEREKEWLSMLKNQHARYLNLDNLLFMTTGSKSHRPVWIPMFALSTKVLFTPTESARLLNIFNDSAENSALLQFLESAYAVEICEKETACPQLCIRSASLYSGISTRQLNCLVDGKFFMRLDEETEWPVIVLPPDEVVVKAPLPFAPVNDYCTAEEKVSANSYEVTHELTDDEQAEWIKGQERAWRRVTDKRRIGFLQIITQLARI